MRHPVQSLLLACALALAGSGYAAAERIGLAAPLEGPLALLGQQMRDGAEIAARLGGHQLIAEDDACDAPGGERAARAFIEAEVQIAVGFLCSEALEAALPLLRNASIPVVTSGVRNNGITDRRTREDWLVWRAAPRADAELAAVADILVSRWRDELFAIVDDGTIYGRELAESLRLAAELAGLQPVFFDTFRPQSDNQVGLVARLRRAGATHIFVGGERDDVAIIQRDAAGLDYDPTIAGGDALRAAGEIPLATGTLMIGLPEWAEMLDEEAVERFTEAGVIPEGYVVPSYVSVEIAAQAMATADAADRPIADVLSTGSFDTLIGTLSFDDKGDLSENLFQLLRYDGERFLPVE
ncbi:branched-chain amino acid ABC transporter substrate-binding protein [Neoaquamicrobium sediminum]|uniref:branched-chain amino acid ABC transporter substrate-binding protein n=1 Tax=Neoaquamicrobium sediminum TaxID=1849104 RepID=UPI003BA86FAB